MAESLTPPRAGLPGKAATSGKIVPDAVYAQDAGRSRGEGQGMQGIGVFGTAIVLLSVFAVIAVSRAGRTLPRGEHAAKEGVAGRIALVGTMGLLFVVAVAMQVPHVNGVVWVWHWREPPRIPVFVYSFLVLPPLLWVVARIAGGGALRATPLLLSLALLCFLFQILALYGEENSLAKLSRIVRSPQATSYFTDALVITDLGAWLSDFHLLDLHLHSNTHPPGPILFYHLLIELLGETTAVWTGGLLLGGMASTGVFLAYRLARFWGGDERASLLAAANYATLPAMIVFVPEFDQVYPVVAMAMILAWAAALSDGRPGNAVLFGATLSIALFFTYALLTLGAFFLLFALHFLYRNPQRRQATLTILQQTAIALALVIAVYSAIHYLTGYSPLLAFLDAVAWQAAHEQRPYAPALLVNLYDFALGGGMMLAILFALHLARARALRRERPDTLGLSLIAVATILIVNVSGLLNYETARVWLFLQPLVLVPASLELARYPRSAILGFFLLQWTLVSTLKANMLFIGA